MDPAALGQLRTAVEAQGSLLGTHQGEIQQVNQNLRSMADTLSALTSRIEQLQTPSPLVPAPLPLPREPRLPPPQSYNGEPGTCRSFLSQCSLSLELQASTFPTERSKIAYIITLLSGKAREWGTALWDADDPCCTNYNAFTNEMRRVFDRSLSGREAAGQMLRLRQGTRSAYDYAIEFRTLAASCGWNECAMFDVFFHGLSETVKDELVSQELPSGLNELMDLAGRVDARLRLRRKERTPPLVRTRPMSPPQTADSPDQPMQVDRARISPEERQRRRDKQACFYCGQTGHFRLQCPVKGGGPH